MAFKKNFLDSNKFYNVTKQVQAYKELNKFFKKLTDLRNEQ